PRDASRPPSQAVRPVCMSYQQTAEVAGMSCGYARESGGDPLPPSKALEAVSVRLQGGQEVLNRGDLVVDVVVDDALHRSAHFLEHPLGRIEFGGIGGQGNERDPGRAGVVGAVAGRVIPDNRADLLVVVPADDDL